jgi:plastocyanin
MTVLRRLSLGLIFISGSTALAEGVTAPADEVIVHIENFTFNPDVISVKPGTKVTWENDDDIPHLVAEDVGKFRSPALDTGEKYSSIFAEAGEVSYFCGLHPHMKGKIIVKP